MLDMIIKNKYLFRIYSKIKYLYSEHYKYILNIIFNNYNAHVPCLTVFLFLLFMTIYINGYKPLALKIISL